MKIVADENIPYIREAFSTFGDITLVSGRNISREQLADAQMVLVRSVTPVNAHLLEGTSVQFVATATVGTDHIDTAYLDKKGIGFAYAPGSNADSVAQYVCTALTVLKNKYHCALEKMILGIVGAGNIGSRMNRHAATFGMSTLLCDPPLQRKTGNSGYVSFEKVIEESDIITFHVPLVTDGADRTIHLVNDDFFSSLRPGTFLINTSRGDVIDEASLLRHRRRLGGLVLDVWNNEPNISKRVCAVTDIATPHIAGYSFDGKVRGTEAIYRAACSFFGVSPSWSVHSVITSEKIPIDGINAIDPLGAVLQKAYPIIDDDAKLRRIIFPESPEVGSYFDGLRKNYPKRFEFSHFSVATRMLADDIQRQLHQLGFTSR